MNTSIKKIAEKSVNDNVLGIAAKMIGWSGKKMIATFTKKDGSVRKMTFTTTTDWNALNGISLTKGGLKMLMTKVSRGMATVTEILGEGVFQPRTINLNKVITLELA